MRDPSSLNEWRVDYGDWVLSFYTSRLVDSGLSLSPVQPTRLCFSLELAP